MKNVISSDGFFFQKQKRVLFKKCRLLSLPGFKSYFLTDINLASVLTVFSVVFQGVKSFHRIGSLMLSGKNDTSS